jgi:hypothetical protein
MHANNNHQTSARSKPAHLDQHLEIPPRTTLAGFHTITLPHLSTNCTLPPPITGHDFTTKSYPPKNSTERAQAQQKLARQSLVSFPRVFFFFISHITALHRRSWTGREH